MAEEEVSLKSLFIRAKNASESLESLNPKSDEFSMQQKSALQALEGCQNLISQVGLYSTNEEVDDISTQNLQYLTVDYLLAQLLLRSYSSDRTDQIKQASELLESFLTRLDHYDLLNKSDRQNLSRYKENRKSFSIISVTNAEERRRIKVARFQEEKALKDKLKLLRNESNNTAVDDEVHRKLYLAEIHVDIHETFQSLDMISQELTILSQIRQVQNTDSERAGDDDRQRQNHNNAYSDRLDGQGTMAGLGRRGGPLLDTKGKPLQPFTLTDKRTKLQKGVFRPGHNLPTMSIDEYLEEERRRGGIIDGGGNANTPQAELDEDDMDLVDAATYNAREWDEFVEANPKGADFATLGTSRLHKASLRRTISKENDAVMQDKAT